MFADCEGCVNCTETSEGYYCEWFGTDINRVNSCHNWSNEDDTEEDTNKTCTNCVDNVIFALKNSVTIDALVMAKDKITVEAIISRAIKEGLKGN